VLPGVLTALGLAIFFWGRERPRVAFRLAGLTFLFLVGLIVFEIWWGRNAETNGAIETWGSATPIATWARLAILTFAAVGFWRAAKRPRRIFQLAGALTVLYACTLFASAWLLATFLLLLGLGLFVQLIDFRYALRALGIGSLVIGGYVLLRDWELLEVFYFPLLAVGVIAIGFVLLFTSKHPELTLRIVGRAIIVLAIAAFFVGQHLRRDGLSIGHIPAGTPINLVANINSPGLYEDPDRLRTLADVFIDLARVSNRRLATLNHPDVPNLVPNLLKINKCPDLVLDRGHTFGSQLSDDEKLSLIEYLKTL
jgi:hypothetical protein